MKQAAAGDLEQAVLAAFDVGGPWRVWTSATSHASNSAGDEPERWRRPSRAARDPLMVEAGTGVCARPLPTWCRRPAVGQPRLVSTATKSLQDQLYLRDLPRLVRSWARRCASPCSRPPSYLPAA